MRVFSKSAWFLALLLLPPALCQIAPARLEINLGPVPIDKYHLDGLNAGTIPSCPDSWTVQRCIKRIFDNPSGDPDHTPNQYVAQQVKGVRFKFGLGGGAHSTPFDSSGNWRATWLSNLQTFFHDLKSYGIERVTPTPVLVDDWSAADPIDPSGFKYESTLLDTRDRFPLFFQKWLPFGLLDCRTDRTKPEWDQPNGFLGGCDHGWVDGVGNSSAYYVAKANPQFWGWTPFLTLMNKVVEAVKLANLQIGDLDLQNEVDLVNATVYGRLFWDPVTQTDVITQLRGILETHYFNPNLVTASTKIERPRLDGFTCDSVYGDSAQVIYTSALNSMLQGGAFGDPGYSSDPEPRKGLRCKDQDMIATYCGSDQNYQCLFAGMPVAPLYYWPWVINMHAHVCIEGPSPDGSGCLKTDSTSTARQFYDDVYRYLIRHPLPAGTGERWVVFGETVSDQEGALDTRFGILNNIRHTDGFTKQMAQWNVAGFRQSYLYLHDPAHVVLRPWNYLMEHELKRAPSIIWPEKEADPANPSEKAVIKPPRDLTQPPYRPQLEWGAARYKVPHNLSSFTGTFIPTSADWIQEYHLEIKSAQGATIFSGNVGLNTYKNDLDLTAYRGQQVTVRISANVHPEDADCPQQTCWQGGGKKWRFLKTCTYYALEAPGALSVAPDTITLAASQAAGFSAQINGASTQAVTWTLDPPLGSLSATQGATTTYTAPSSISSPTTVTITATSTQNPNNSDSAIIYLQSGVTFSISPSSAILTAGGSGTTFSASGYPYGTQWIDWTVTPEIGALQPMGALAGYTPPAALAAHTMVTLRATTDAGASATATILVQANCSYAISPAQGSVPAGGGSGSVTVTAPAGCNWTAAANTSWITITSGASGSGNGTVAYSAAANPDPVSRQGTITIAGQLFTLTQDASCGYSLSAAQATLGAGAASARVYVSAPAGCNWTAASNHPSWLTVTSGASGTGNGTVTYAVTANTAAPSRQGTLTIAGQTFHLTQSGSSTWYNSSWTRRKPVTIGAGQVTGTQNDFPILVRVTDAGLRDYARSDGFDILFTLDGHTVKLNHEIERFVKATGELAAWVRIPTLSDAADTTVYMYYGNAAAADQSTPAAVWDSAFKGVWRLREDPGAVGAGGIKDSTANANHGADYGAMTAANWVDGRIGKAIDFDGTDDYIGLGNPASLQIAAQITISAWVNTRVIPGAQVHNIAAHGYRFSPDQEVFFRLYNGKYQAGSWNGVDHKTEATIPSQDLNAWVHLAATYDGQQWRLYRNGAQAAATADSTGAITVNADWAIAARGGGGSRFFNGRIDELRIAAVSRGAGWLATEFNNQKEGSVFLTLGPEEPLAGCSYSIDPISASLGAGAGSGSVSVTAGSGCNWTATSNAAWITITSGSTGSGNGSVNYSVQANTGSARQGTLTIAGHTFTVNQAAGAGGGTTLFSADFSSGSLAGWTVVDQGTIDAPSNWQIVSGELRQSSNIYSSSGDPGALSTPGTYIWTGDAAWSNYTVSVRLKSTDDDALGIMFGYQNTSNYYRFSMDQSRNYRRLVKVVNGSWTQLAQDTQAYTQGVWYHVQVGMVAGVITVYIDGQQILQVNDSSFTGGRIALFSWANAGSYFDDVVVTASGPPAGPWYNAAWGYRKPLTIQAAKVAGSLSNFPILVRLPADAQLAARARADGNDLLFTLDDHATKLDHEIESFNGATGELVAWVRMPSLSNAANTTIHLYYGNGGASNQQNRTGVWDTHHRGVWHLGNGYSTAAGFYTDSTANANHGALTDANGNSAAVAGKAGGALRLNGDADFLNVGSASSLDDVNPRTLEFWVKREGTTIMQLAAKSGSGGYFSAEIQAAGSSGANTVRLWEKWSNNAGWRGATQLTGPNKFYYVVVAYDSGSTGNSPSIYIDGVAETVTVLTAPSGSHASDAANAMRIGAASWGEYFSGVIDEVRLSAALRPPAWIATTYNTIHSPETFLTPGPEEAR
jgi:hypothetical protein